MRWKRYPDIEGFEGERKTRNVIISLGKDRDVSNKGSPPLFTEWNLL
jgi:hypothetical protein